MALSIGTLVGYLDLDDSKFESKVGKAEGRFSKFGGALGKTVLGATTAVAAAASAGIGYTLYKGFQRLSAIDQARAKLTGLGHSAEDVNHILGTSGPVINAVRGTAFSLGDAATVAAGAIAATGETGDGLQEILTLVGDTATIAGSSMGEMGAIFNKVAASNRLTMGEVNQLQDRGIPIMTMLADKFGVTAEEAIKMVSTGKVQFADFRDALQENLGGAAQESGNTVAGAWANMHAAVGRVGANMLSGVFPQLAGGFGSITEAIDNLAGGAEVFGQKFGNALATAAGVVLPILIDVAQWIGTNLPAAIDKALGVLGPFATAVAQVLRGEGTGRLAQLFDVPQNNPAIQALVRVRNFVTTDLPAGFGVLRGVIEGVFNIITGKGTGLLAKTLGVEQGSPIITTVMAIKDSMLGLWESVQSAVGYVAPLISSALNLVVTAFAAIGAGVASVLPRVIDAFSSLISAIGPFLGVLKQIIDFIQPVLVPVLFFLAQTLMSVVAGAVEGVARVIRGLTMVLQGVIDFVKAVFAGEWGAAWQAVKDIAVGIFLVIAGAIQTWLNVTVLGIFRGGLLRLASLWRGGLDGLKNFAIRSWSAIGNAFSAALRFIANLVTGAVRSYIGFWTNLFRTIINLATNGWAVLRSAFGGALAAIRTIVSQGLTAVANFFRNQMNTIRSVVQTAINRVRTIFTQGMSRIRTSVSNGLNRVVTFFRNLPGRILSGLGNMGALLYGAGQDVIRGLIGGIKDMAGQAVGAVKGVVGDSISAAKNLLGINSPSRVFMEIGHSTGEGMVKGINAEQRAVRRASEALVHVPDASLPTFTRGDGSVWDRAAHYSGRGSDRRDDRPNVTVIQNNPVAEPETVGADKAAQLTAALGMGD